MKSSIFLILVISLFAYSCNKCENIQNQKSPITGNWEISSLVKENIDKTASFNNYNIQFTNDNKILMKNNLNPMSNMCSWSNKNNIYHFNMMNMHNDLLNDLNDDWNLNGITDSTCNFKSVNKNCTFAMRRK